LSEEIKAVYKHSFDLLFFKKELAPKIFSLKDQIENQMSTHEFLFEDHDFSSPEITQHSDLPNYSYTMEDTKDNNIPEFTFEYLRDNKLI
jgi:hypothetical protein